MPKCVRILALAIAIAQLLAAETAAEHAFKVAEQAVRAGDSFKAYLFYAQAAQLDPQNTLYAQRKVTVQSSPALRPQIDLAPEPPLLAKITDRDASDSDAGAADAAEAGATDAKAEDSAAPDAAAEPVATEPVIPEPVVSEPLTGREMAMAEAEPPPRLKEPAGPKSFDLKGDAQMVIQNVGAGLGIQMVFDPMYQPLPGVTFRVDDETFQETLRTLERVTDSFFVPINEHAALVVRDTTVNRVQYTPTMSVAVPIPERLSAQEAQEIMTAVQQILEIRRISLDATKRLVFFRDSVAKATAARALFNTLSRSRAQIAVDIEILSVAKNSSLSYGLSLPTSASIVDFGKSVAGFTQIPGNGGGFTKFLAFGGGATPLGLGIASAAAFATLSKASSETLLNAQLVSLDGQAATFHVGDRYPVISATFSGLTSNTVVSPTLQPTINYVDLGIQLKMTPTVHEDGEVSLDLDAEFKTLGAGGANGIPVIGSRQYQGKVRLRNGEWAVVAGLVAADDSRTPTGVAGLSSLPFLGPLFTHQTHTTDSADVLIVLKPHLVAEPPWQDVSQPFWTGTETRPLSIF